MRKKIRPHLSSIYAISILFLGLILFAAQPLPAQAAMGRPKSGKVIVVILSKQWLYAYEDGKEVFNTAVLTGRDGLPTPIGTYSIFSKESPAVFRSPWPPGSPNWYPPTPIRYAMQWKPGGFYLHDADWHTVFGPGTNHPHQDPTYGWQDGSHGCVSMPIGAAAWLYGWAPIGTTVQIKP